MSNQPLTRDELKLKIKSLVDLKLEEFSASVADIILVERLKILSHSDQSTGEWRKQSEFPREPEHD